MIPIGNKTRKTLPCSLLNTHLSLRHPFWYCDNQPQNWDLKTGSCCLLVSLTPPPFLLLAAGTIGMLYLFIVSWSTLLLLLLLLPLGLWFGLGLELTEFWVPLPGTRGIPPLLLLLLLLGLSVLGLLLLLLLLFLDEPDPPDWPPPEEEGDLVVDLFSQFLRKLLTNSRT